MKQRDRYVQRVGVSRDGYEESCLLEPLGRLRRAALVEGETAQTLVDLIQALDDNDLVNYSGKATFAMTSNQKIIASYLWNNKNIVVLVDGNSDRSKSLELASATGL